MSRSFRTKITCLLPKGKGSGLEGIWNPIILVKVSSEDVLWQNHTVISLEFCLIDTDSSKPCELKPLDAGENKMRNIKRKFQFFKKLGIFAHRVSITSVISLGFSNNAVKVFFSQNFRRRSNGGFVCVCVYRERKNLHPILLPACPFSLWPTRNAVVVYGNQTGSSDSNRAKLPSSRSSAASLWIGRHLDLWMTWKFW